MYTKLKKGLESANKNKHSSLYLTNLTKKNIYNNPNENEENILFENIYYKDKLEKIIEVDPLFSKTQKYNRV